VIDSDRFALTRLERATGVVFGQDPFAPRMPHAPKHLTPLQALEQAMLPALQQAPCCVCFSGGRDSSAVLAAATWAARRHGLPLPIPVTLRYSAGGPEADESEWQQLVVTHLGLDDWVRLEVGETLDPLGKIGRDVLRRHGLIFPLAPHTLVPMLEVARGGALLTGTGGDEAFLRQSRVNDVLARRVPVQPRDPLRVLIAVGPRPVRRAAAARKIDLEYWPWLRRPALEGLRTSWAAEGAYESINWGRNLGRMWRSRGFQLTLRALDLVARDNNTLLLHPLADPLFLSTVARAAGFNGFGGRTEGMRTIFGDVLPDKVNSRPTKARFDRAFWTSTSQAFAAGWDGSGVDEELVDVDALRAYWTSETPPPAPTITLLKQAWLAAEEQRSRSGDVTEQKLEGPVH
jgi:hypothetical protein